jgi:beta-glucanase (GH16 family)
VLLTFSEKILHDTTVVSFSVSSIWNFNPKSQSSIQRIGFTNHPLATLSTTKGIQYPETMYNVTVHLDIEKSTESFYSGAKTALSQLRSSSSVVMYMGKPQLALLIHLPGI